MVITFKAVYTMEMTRRENDKRIRLLYVDMQDMMAVLVELKDVKDPRRVIQGKTIEARLEGLVKGAKNDIKECANACDAYSKKGLISKALKGSIWQDMLKGYGKKFVDRRHQFMEALAIHTTRLVDRIHDKMEVMHDKISQCEKWMENLVPTIEAMITNVVGGKDTNAIQEDVDTLNRLVDLRNEHAQKQKGDNTRMPYTLSDLKNELSEDLHLSISSNQETFDRKFRLQYERMAKELVDANKEVTRAVKELEGPHDRIKDKELRQIWRDMNWRRNVKASLFVMTLRDHFRDRIENMNLMNTHAIEDRASGSAFAKRRPYADRFFN